MIKTAVFPVAGLGTRILPLTKSLPKEMLPVLDKPLIQYAVEEAREAGIERFIFISSAHKGIIQDHFDINLSLNNLLKEKNKNEQLLAVEHCTIEAGKAIFIRQGKPKGLGHAILMAKDCLEGETYFAVLSPDDFLADRFYLKSMIKKHEEMQSASKELMLAAVREVPLADTKSYGILDVLEKKEDLIRAKALVEKPDPQAAPSNFAIIGRYILPTSLFSILETQQPTTGNEIQLTDAMQRAIDKGYDFSGFLYKEKLFDCGQLPGWLKANLWMGEKAGII